MYAENPLCANVTQVRYKELRTKESNTHGLNTDSMPVDRITARADEKGFSRIGNRSTGKKTVQRKIIGKPHYA